LVNPAKFYPVNPNTREILGKKAYPQCNRCKKENRSGIDTPERNFNLEHYYLSSPVFIGLAPILNNVWLALSSKVRI